jgi:hypothetical protein
MSYCSDHQHLQIRKPEQSHYTKIAGMNLTTTPAQRNHTSGSQGPTSTNTTEKVSHQIANPQSNIQTKNPPYQDQHHPSQAKTDYPHKPAHSSLTKISAGLPHHQTRTPPPDPDTEDLGHQTYIALASILFAKNNNRPQQIWRLCLLRLQQQRLLSDLLHHQHPQQPPQLTLELNESLVIYTTPCTETHQPLEDLEGLADLADLEDLENPADQEDQEHLRDPLQQYLWQPRQEETLTTGLWEIFPRYSMESIRMPEHSSIPYLDTVTIRNHAYQKLFSFVVTHPSSLLPLPPTCIRDWHVIKLRISINDRHVVKLHNT